MVSVQGLFEQTKAIQAGEKREKERENRENVKNLNKKKKDKLIEEKSTEKKHYKQLFNRGTKPDISIQNGSHVVS